MGSRGSGIRCHFPRRLDDGLHAIHILVTDDLQHGFSVCFFLQLDYGDILKLGFGYHSLNHEGVNVAFIPVKDPDIVNVAIAIQIEVVDFRIR
jgi:hypothetical protein